MPLISLDAQQLFYESYGDGPAVLLIHSFPHDHRVWQPQATALANRFRIITPDLPSFGQSPRMERFSIEAAADLMIKLMTRLELPRVIVGGISMGGYISLAIAKRRPPQLAGLILTDTKAAADTPEARQKRSDSIELIRNDGFAHVIGQMLPTQVVQAAAKEQLKTIMESQTPGALIAGMTALRDRPDYSEVLATIDVPTLLLFGEHDSITPPSIAQTLCKSLKNSTTTIVPEAGHISTLDQPQRVTDALRVFLQQLS